MARRSEHRYASAMLSSVSITVYGRHTLLHTEGIVTAFLMETHAAVVLSGKSRDMLRATRQ